MTACVRIEAADPLGADALGLLRDATVEARQLYPELFSPGSAWPTNAPVGDRGAFVVAYLGGDTAGCGALRMIDSTTAEIRRMYVRRSARRAGVGRALLAHLEEEARLFGYHVLRLETGNRQQAAMALYESAGFVRIPPFGDYVNDPTSVCFERHIPAVDRR